jgi:transposase
MPFMMKKQPPKSYENPSKSQEDKWPFPFSRTDWDNTPKPVQEFNVYLVNKISELEHQILELESRLNQNSQNSNRPPSSDSPYDKPSSKKKKKKRRAGAKKGHKGHKQIMLEPTKEKVIKPESCSCGNKDFPETEPFYTHQEIELPKIEMDVCHYILHQGQCPCCGKLNKAQIPKGHQTGYGPRLSAFIGEVSGIQGNSRSTVKEFCSSVLGIPISKGAVQKVIDRVSQAIKPHYEAIAQVAREATVNYIDETSWFINGSLMWLWVMVNTSVAFFMIHPNRSKEAFLALIKDWEGILVSDGYRVYQKWINLRQMCLAHLIRTAKGLSEKKDPEIAAFGRKTRDELKRLCKMAKAPPTKAQWRAFYARFIHLIFKHQEREDEAGKFAQRLIREMDSLWVFLEVQGVEPTNNRGERALRFGVLWRKRSQGTASEKGNRWVERIISLKQTCSLRSMPTFPVLVEAIECYFKEQVPDLSWIEQPVN